MAFPFITTPRRGSCVMKTIDGYRTTALSEWGAIQPIAGGRSNAIPSPMVSEITIQSEGATFAPVIVLNSGYTLGVNATALWTFADASTDATLTPSKNYGSAASRANTLVVTPWAALRRINVGYGGEDGGSVDIEHVTQQNVSAITGLVAARAGLKELCINGSLVTSIAISSLSNLVTLECYEGSLISLSPPASIKRLCVENNDIAGTLNLAHCSALEDLRAALNLCETIILPTVAPNLWHICIRNNPYLVDPPADFSGYSALEDLYVWGTNLTGEVSLPASAKHLIAYDNEIESLAFAGGDLTQIDLTNNALEDTDAIINATDAQGLTNGTLYLNGGTNAPPTSASATAQASLAADGWTIRKNVASGTSFVTTGDTAVFLVSCSGDPTDLTIYWDDNTSTTHTVGSSAVDFSRSGLGAGVHTHQIAAVNPELITALQSDGNSSTVSFSNMGYFSGLTSLWFYMAAALTGVGSIAACIHLDTVRMGSTAMSAATQDAVAADLVAAGLSGGNWFYTSASGFTSASAADRATLATRSWTLTAA
jgi:hypothetical protein